MIYLSDNALLDYELSYKEDDAVLHLIRVIKELQSAPPARTFICDACGAETLVEAD